MILLVCAVVIGFAAGRLRKPLGAHGYRPRFAHIWLLAVGAAANVVAYGLTDGGATVAMAISLALLLGFVGANRHVTGVVVIGLGLFVNLLGLVANNGMPVRPSALVAAGVVEEAEVATVDFRGPRHLERDSDPVPVLGDVLPVGLPLGREVISFGDLIVVFGCLDAVRELSRRRRPRRSVAADLDARLVSERLSSLGGDGDAAEGRVIDLSSPGGDGDGTDPGQSGPAPLPRRRPLVALTQE